MELVRLVAPVASRGEVASRANQAPVVFRCADADTVLVAASLADKLTAPLGVWLVVTSDYPAQLAARDLATLAALTWLEHAVIESHRDPVANAEVVRALLSDEPVTFANDVARLAGAFNRPAPPRPIRVWAFDEGTLVDGEVLRPRRDEAAPYGELTYFA